jgi:YidC/Oxa1 family membrane protein insertase
VANFAGLKLTPEILGMDKNSLIGFALVAAIMITWFTVFQPEPVTETAATEITSAAAPTDNEVDATTQNDVEVGTVEAKPLLNDSLAADALKDRFGAFAAAAQAPSSEMDATAAALRDSTDLLTLEFSPLGGRITGAWLNEYKTYDGLPLPVITNSPVNRFSFTFAHGNRTIPTEELYFMPVASAGKMKGKTKEMRLRASISEDRYIDHIYTYENGKYDIGFKAEYHNLSDLIRNKHLELNWILEIPRTEKSLENMRNQTTVFYMTGEDVENLNEASTETESENVKLNTGWVAYKNQFFSAILIPEKPFEEIKIESMIPAGEQVNKIMSGIFHVPAAFNGDQTVDFRIYLGPNEYYTLRSYDRDFDKMISLGWSFISYINKFIVLPTFKFLEDKIGNYGIIIFLLAIFIRLLVFPFAIKSYVSMAKMRIVNESSEMKELEEKHKSDNTKLQTEKMAYYSSVGVSPLSGCLPLLFQMPIILAMFSFFPASIELRQQSFLWATDLSSYDSVMDLSFSIPFYGDHVSLFTLLMTLSTIAFTWVSQQTQGNTNPQMKQLQWMGYVMPIIFLGILNNYASGLSYYYFVANVLSITQSYLIKATINDKKLLDQLHSYKLKKKSGGGKKTRIQSWMEQQQKKQQEMQKELKSRKK